MARLIRVDAELVRRGLARSRAHASELITQGRVLLDAVVVTKPARQMNPAQALRVIDQQEEHYASRGAYKLLGALDYLGENAPNIHGATCLDAGASTGGFTDVLLRRGATRVWAVDVGYGQIAWRLREDSRVEVIERTNIRTLDPEIVTPLASIVVGDLSFISLTLVIEPLCAASSPEAEFLLMVKPQFEVGKENLGAHGVVRDPALHHAAVAKVARAALKSNLNIFHVAPSPLPGPAGNVEYFLHMAKPAQLAGRTCPPLHEADLDTAITEAIAARPAGNSLTASETSHSSKLGVNYPQSEPEGIEAPSAVENSSTGQPSIKLKETTGRHVREK